MKLITLILILSASCFGEGYTNKIAFLGDSNMTQGTSWKWPYTVATLSQGRIQTVYNGGIDGSNTGNPVYPAAATSGMVFRLPDALAASPQFLLVSDTANDCDAGYTTSDSQANLTYIGQQVVASGAVPILATMAPKGGAGTCVINQNAMVRALATAQGWALFDMYAVLALNNDGSTWANSLWTTDNTHLSTQGSVVVGTAFVAQPVFATFAHTKIQLTTTNSDASSLNGNTLFQTTAAGTGLCTGQTVPTVWGCNQGSPGGSPATPTFSFVTDSSAVGSWYRTVMPDASGFTQGYWQMGPTATVTVGHTIQISFRIRTSGFNVKDGSEAYFNIQNTPSPVFLGISSNVDGICQWRFVANSASIKFWLHNNDAGHGSVTVDIAQFSMVDLTTQGGSYTGTGTWTNAFLFPMPSPLSKE